MPAVKITLATTRIKTLPGYMGDGSKVLYDNDLTQWVTPVGSVVEDQMAVITFPALSSVPYNAANFTVSITSNSPATITVVSANTNIATVTNNNNGTWTIDVIAVGLVNIIASQPIVTGFTEAEDAVRVLVVDDVLISGEVFLDTILNNSTNAGGVTFSAPHSYTLGNGSQWEYATIAYKLPAGTNGYIVWDTGTTANNKFVGFTLVNDSSYNPTSGFGNGASRYLWMAGTLPSPTGLQIADRNGSSFIQAANGETKFKLSRTSGVWKAYIGDGNSWSLIYTYLDINTADAYVHLTGLGGQINYLKGSGLVAL